MLPTSREVSFLVPDEDNGRKRIVALIHGDRDAPNGAILFCHGFQDNANSFHFLAPRLARKGFFCVAIEFTGHGKSDHSNSQMSHFAYVFDVCDVADSLQLNKFHLVGHSMGAIVSSLVAGALTTRVLSLVMIDAVGSIGSKEGSDAPKLLERALTQRAAMISRKPRVYESMAECMQRWSESPFAPRGEENLRLIVSRGTEEIFDPNGFISGFRFRHDPKLKSLPPFRIGEEQSHAFLKRIACPVTAILANDRDPIWSAGVEATHMALMRAKIYRIAGGHHPHMSNVEETLEIILEHFANAAMIEIDGPKSKL